MPRIRYRLCMPEPHTHLFHVEMEVREARAPVELVMPVWTPGSYLLREFARNVHTFAATDGAGRPLGWSKTDKTRWRTDAPEDGVLRVRYTVYAAELSVRTSHLDASHGYVNGASAFIYAEGGRNEPLELRVEPPAGWRTTTALAPAGEPETFRASGYDELADAPLEIGTHALLEWEGDGLPHRYAVWGRGNLEGERLVADTRCIVDATRDFWGALPYRDFTFILHLTAGASGGLEHRDSTTLLVDRWAFRGRAYEETLALVAHEFFHVWNGKRIRPAPLGPFDYTRENYTRNLWVVEGVTTYYTDLLLRRAGLITPERYLERLGEAITAFQALPGRRLQTLEEASWDAWTRFYRPDPGTPNAQISYYRKGALVALLLDLRIRAATRNARSLDDVMGLLWERWGKRDVGFPEEGGFEAIAEEVAGEKLDAFWERHLRGTEELDFAGALAAAGVRLEAAPPAFAEGPRGAPPRAGREPLGMRVQASGGRTVVTHVLADTPAFRAGVNAGDELLALNGLRVDAATLPRRVAEAKRGHAGEITVFRRDELLRIPVEVAAPAPTVRLARMEQPSAPQAAVLAGWLRTDIPTAANPALDGGGGAG